MTKSKGIGRGGHREGAGRPAIDKGKTANFATRITQKTRDLLDAEAHRQGKSVAWVAEKALRLGLEEKSAKGLRSDDLRALFFFIETLSQYVVGHHHRNDPQYPWQSNPYLFEAFRRAITYLMSPMRPAGEITPPPPEPMPPTPTIPDDIKDDPFVRFADFAADVVRFKYPDSVDDYARDRARQVIERARVEMALR